jgi:SpoIID/LytB domain protein
MLATRAGGRRIGRLTAITLLAALAIASVPADRADAVPNDTSIVIDGGGWGHGIGMPQWGAQAQAVHGGYSYDQILSYWYTGTGLRQAAQSKSRNDKQVPDPLRIGINYVQLSGEVREYRPFRWQDFRPVNGPVEVCLEGESQGSCSFTANPGETWRYRYFAEDGGFCEIAIDGDYGNPVYTHPTDCDVRLFWSDQPNTRVWFPGSDVARTFARGHIAFRGGVEVNGQKGFHLNVVLTLEEYMYGIGEVPNTWHMEALKAQAVAARTYGAEKAARNGLRSDCSCHLVWDTMDQAYRAWYTSSTNPITEGSPSGDRWKAAVDSTAGLIVVGTSGGNVMAETYYSSSTGGATENVSDMWGSNQANYPYLVSRPDPWSVMYAGTPTESASIRWRHTRTAGQIVSALTSTSGSCSTAIMPGLTELISLEITETHVSGSPRAIEVTGIVNGQVTKKTLVHRGASCQSLTGTLRSRLNIRGHFIHSFAGFLKVERLAGANRFETAVAISKASYPGGADVVYLSVGTNYPDALATGPAAAHEGAPILLVNSTSLPDVTRAELQRLAPTQVRVLGGDQAIAPSVVSAVSNALPGVEISRIAGANRYETAVEVSKASFTESVTTVYIATGENFPDGLVAAPAAAYNDAPLLLVRANEVPAVVRDELTRLAPEKIIIVGGTSVVSSAVQSTLGTYAASVQRISASDRYAQSAATSAATFPADTGVVYIAVGTNFPDALAGGTALGTALGPILLVTSNGIPSAVATELMRIRPSRIVILGGPVVVSEAVATQLAQYLG